MLLFVCATNKWVSWATDLNVYHSTDDVNYRAMASAAPGLLHHRIVEWHAERFPVHWVVGETARITHISLTASYRVYVFLVAIGVCMVLGQLVRRIDLSLLGCVVCLGLFIFNPYTLRPMFLSPGGVADLVFVLGATIATTGLVLRAPLPLLAGLLLASVARQTAVPAAAVAAAAVVLDPGWRARLGTHRLPIAAAAVVLPVACYALIRVVAHPFSGPSPSLHTITLLGAKLQLSGLAQHFGRCVIVLLAASVMLAAAWWTRRLLRNAPPPTDASQKLNTGAVLGCLAFGAAIFGQAMVLNPAWAVYNENRLSMLGLVPLIVAFGLVLADVERRRREPIRAAPALLIVALLAVGSFHHIYSLIGGSTSGLTVALQIAVSGAAAIVLLLSTRPQRALAS
jgi:hypothetical protein